MRPDGRQPAELRPVRIERGWLRWAEGSALIEMGNTRVLCSASILNQVPDHLRGKGTGWVTAEYAMLPRSSPTRIEREAVRGRIKGRTHEIMRLIGRSFRPVVDLVALGERTVILDCDVIQADGGTRTASVTGSCVALHDALSALGLPVHPMRELVAAVSVGLVDGEVRLDLDYREDSRAATDMNLVMAESGRWIEVQGTAEHAAFDDAELAAMLQAGRDGIVELLALQRRALEIGA